jgi:peroxiredoxin Q/BCP
MAQLRQDSAEFEKRSTAIIIIGPENSQAFQRFFEQNDLHFYGLPDPGHSVLKLYGQEVNLFKLGRMPAQVLVDQRGIARFVHYGHAMNDIPENAEILALIDEINQEALSIMPG